MLYTSEVYNDDSPYWIDLPWEKHLPDEQKEGLLMVPYNYDCELQSLLESSDSRLTVWTRQ